MMGKTSQAIWHCNPRSRGSIYVLVLMISVMIAVIGISSVAISRVQLRMSGGTNGVTEASFYADSAVDLALYELSQDPNWRTSYTHDTWVSEQAIGSGSFKWKFVDQVDTDLSDNATDPVWLIAWGMAGSATQKLSVGLQPAPRVALDVLATTVHASQDIFLNSGASVTARAAPLSTDANFDNRGTLYGSLLAVTQSGSGAVTGDVVVPSATKDLPAESVFASYVAKATVLLNVVELKTVILTPTLNETGGGLNAEGVYYINTGGNDLLIEGLRLHGTLVVNCGSGTVRIDKQVAMQNYRDDYPVLIVDGNIELRFYSNGDVLDEAAWSHNFNPPGAPYHDSTDGDQSDEYPSQIQGLVHCTRGLFMRRTALVIGAIICEQTATFSDTPKVIHDYNLIANPPEGYTQPGSEMVISKRGWNQVVD
jgi:hypothetical protein